MKLTPREKARKVLEWIKYADAYKPMTSEARKEASKLLLQVRKPHYHYRSKILNFFFKHFDELMGKDAHPQRIVKGLLNKKLSLGSEIIFTAITSRKMAKKFPEGMWE